MRLLPRSYADAAELAAAFLITRASVLNQAEWENALFIPTQGDEAAAKRRQGLICTTRT